MGVYNVPLEEVCKYREYGSDPLVRLSPSSLRLFPLGQIDYTELLWLA